MADNALNTSSGTVIRPSLTVRALALALLFCVEKFVLDFFVDFDAAQTAHGLGEVVRTGQHWGFRFLVAFGVSLALFGYVQKNAGFSEVNNECRLIPLRRSWLLLHAFLFLLLVLLSYSLYGGHGLIFPFAVTVSFWLICALGAVLAAGAALAPWSLWRRGTIALGALWLYAGVAALAGASAMQWSQKLWAPTARLTFWLVGWLLLPLLPSLHADPTTLTLGTDHFAVQVAEVCSGLEGVGLMFAFCCVWLFYFRKEYIFPRALTLIPAGLLLIFLLNVIRIASLVVIGDAGFPDVAVFGFHSQAGWIAFNIAACGIAVVSRRSRWLNHSAGDAEVGVIENPTAPFLVPFLAIVAAGMVAHAASSGFETFYFLRLLAGGVALWAFRRRLAALDWRMSWRGPIAGVLVLVLWLAAAQFLVTRSGMPVALQGMSALPKAIWVADRVCAAVITVPLAEELAFRGYLMRRLQRADFESLRFEHVGLGPLLLSSLLFGLAHGGWWLPGIAAGLVYGAVLRLTGRFGEAVAAHVTTNAILAGFVLIGNQWQLW